MNEQEERLLEILQKELDTRDKRYMFIRLEFPELTSRIDLEGSAYQSSCNIIFEFKKHQKIDKLIKISKKKLEQ